jgi:peptidoglycan/LPS O-acetylase OafA/YrhL
MGLGNAYALFASLASLCALWAMQRITHDANLKTWIGIVKWAHRASIGLVSMAFLISAAHTVYYDTEPRPVDFLLICALLMVLVLSVMRHMTAPNLPRPNGAVARQR